MADEKSNQHTFRHGEYLSDHESSAIVKASPVSVVVVAGMARSGKTTLISELYGLFHRGPFGRFLFAGSQTLPGFEMRSHLARLSSSRQVPDTSRTEFSESPRLLHLRLRDTEKGNSRDILFSDIYGEAFRLAADSADECRQITLFRRANHVVILVDGQQAIDIKFRQVAFASADTLLRQCLDSGMLDSQSNVQVVVTKWDLIAGKGDLFIDEKTEWLASRHAGRLRSFSSHKTALRSTENIRAGTGIETLLDIWTSFPSQEHRSSMVPSKIYCSEFDRLASTLLLGQRRSIR